MGNLIQPIRSTTQIWGETHHQYAISALVSQTSFSGETSGDVAKCRLFSQPSWEVMKLTYFPALFPVFVSSLNTVEFEFEFGFIVL